ncbi:MAG: dihydrofolate reductase [Patescibacteria group bacterium]
MISIIVGTSKNEVIGHGNEIPWHLPRDLKHFAAVTKGHTVLMGRKTYESIVKRLGHPLPERKNVVMARQKENFTAPGCTVVHSLDEAMKATEGENVFVSGGGEIYKLTLPRADKIILTVIDTVAEGDTFFRFNKDDWNLISEEFHAKDEKNKFDCTFYEYERKK